MTWSTWIYVSTLAAYNKMVRLIVDQRAYDNFPQDQYLTVAHRKRMNDLVDAVNSKLVRAIYTLFLLVR